MKKIWKALAVLTAIALFGSAFTACKSDDDGDDDVSVTGVSLDKTSAELEVGGALTLTATVAPDTATNKNVSWSSSAENVATVENGTVTAVATGSAVITVTTEDGGKTASCTITVKKTAEGNVSVTGVNLDKTSAELEVGGALTLTATVAPDTATNKNVSWSSSAENVATVENGTVTAVAAGSAVITVKTEDGEKEATCTITVKEKTSGSEDGSDDTGDMKVEIKF